MTTNVTKLDKNIYIEGVEYTQVEETYNAYMYKYYSGNTIMYEVFKKKIVSNKELYPEENDFAVSAWSFNGEIGARDKLNNI